MTWDYYPDGKLKARSDTGSPKGADVIVVDNTDPDDVTMVSTSTNWITSTSGSGYEGYNHHYNTAGTGTDTFTRNFEVAEPGMYNVYVKYVFGSNRITDAKYTVTHKNGTTTVTKNQQTGGALGCYSASTSSTAPATSS